MITFTPHKLKTDTFEFEYGAIKYKHRFSINRSLDDYKEVLLDKVLHTSSRFVYKTMGCIDTPTHELYITYRDDNNKVKMITLDLSEYQIEIIHRGDGAIYV